LLYPGKRVVLSGETESLKTWFALILCKAEIDAGYPVGWADVDAMGKSAIRDRLRSLGVTDSAISQHFFFFEPDKRLGGDDLAFIVGLVEIRGIRLFVIDSFNPMLGLHGLDPASTIEVEKFWTTVATPICKAGAAVTLIDHVVKNADNRGKYSYGSERKASGAIVHIGFKPLESFGRGKTGRTVLTVHKDRPGFLPRPTVGVLELDSDGENVTYSLTQDRSRVTDKFRPTFLMQRVSEYLAVQPARSRRTRSRGTSPESVSTFVRRSACLSRRGTRRHSTGRIGPSWSSSSATTAKTKTTSKISNRVRPRFVPTSSLTSSQPPLLGSSLRPLL
jgi:hypothetical protein